MVTGPVQGLTTHYVGVTVHAMVTGSVQCLTTHLGWWLCWCDRSCHGYWVRSGSDHSPWLMAMLVWPFMPWLLDPFSVWPLTLADGYVGVTVHAMVTRSVQGLTTHLDWWLCWCDRSCHGYWARSGSDHSPWLMAMLVWPFMPWLLGPFRVWPLTLTDGYVGVTVHAMVTGPVQGLTTHLDWWLCWCDRSCHGYWARSGSDHCGDRPAGSTVPSREDCLVKSCKSHNN